MYTIRRKVSSIYSRTRKVLAKYNKRKTEEKKNQMKQIKIIIKG